MRLGHPTRSITAIAASCVLAVSVICLRADIGFALGAKGASSTSPGAGATPPIASAGFWLVTGNGSVSAFGGVSTHGSPSPSDMSAPIAAMVSTPSGLGYWLAGSNGSLFAYGDASSLGSVNNLILRAPIVGMADTPSGMGYWLVAADGGVFCFGDAGFRGSLGNIALSSPIVAVAPTPTGNGYWLVGSDGSVYSFGDATFHGSLMGSSLAGPITGIASTGTGSGYWLAGSDGGVFAFGDAPFLGSASGSTNGSMIEGIGATHTGDGYILADSAGSTYSFGDAPTFPSQISLRTIGSPVVALALAGPIIGGNVLLVGTYNGIPGAYSTIQSAVDAAKPGDWILVAPGDYHESNDLTSGTSSSDVASGWYAGVDISTPDLHLRGMNRNTVVVDGTKPGSPQCSSNPADQQFGATGIPGISGPVGRNGIEVWKANDVSIENLTVCNFLSASGNGGGNEIWWNGSSANSTIGLTGYTGNYLTATDTFYGTYNGISGGGVYGIFSSAAAGPGVWGNIYASNFDDSGMYIGACRQQCDVWVHDAWMENNALGYSGTNSGGTVVIDRSQFDNNEDGFDTNTQSVGDPPPPQNGQCPGNGVSGITWTTSCWVFMNNNVHDNNNPNAPGYGAVGEPTGAGMTVSGGTNDTVMNNRFTNNGAWGTLFVPYPDSSPGAQGVCSGSGGNLLFGYCAYDPKNDALINNTYVHDGFFGNPSNSDFGQITLFGDEPQNCFSGNSAPDGSSPANLEQVQSVCGPATATASTSGPLLDQVLCATGFAAAFSVSCSGAIYPLPSKTTPILNPVPSIVPTMPNPCVGVPANPWCRGGSPANR